MEKNDENMTESQVQINSNETEEINKIEESKEIE